MSSHANVKPNQGKVKSTLEKKRHGSTFRSQMSRKTALKSIERVSPLMNRTCFICETSSRYGRARPQAQMVPPSQAPPQKPACLRGCEAGWRISRSICRRGRTHRPTVSSMSNDSLQTSHLLSYFRPRPFSHSGSVLWLNNRVPGEMETIDSVKENPLEQKYISG